MSTMPRPFRKGLFRSRRQARPAAASVTVQEQVVGAPEAPPIDIAPNDPVIGYFQSATGAVDVDSLELDSPGKDALQAAGVKMVVPLVSQGELIGLLNLGPRRSEQEYSGDDRKLLGNLASQAAPAVRVGQLVREQEAEVRARERIEQELRVAQLIQQQFLPKELPELGGWHVSAYYRPAREVGGDFYDFIELPEGRVGIVAGDVTDKGVPAALVMASTHSILRGDAPRLMSPGQVLERANDLLYPDIPAAMFVTCLYGVLDPSNGRFQYANAGHNVPYVANADGVAELRATGMPLGLMPGMTYEEKEAIVAPGASVLLHSDGLAEAHGPGGEMFGFPRLMKLLEHAPGGQKLIDALLTDLDSFTGSNWEQEDDITLVTLQRAPGLGSGGVGAYASPMSARNAHRVLEEFSMPSESGNERAVMERVAEAVAGLGLANRRLERLKTAVSEATMNAIEHGNQNRPDLPVGIRVMVNEEEVLVEIIDQGGERPIPDAEIPDIEAKLAGLQKPRGWGLFLIKNMVDDLRTSTTEDRHVVELVMKLKGEADDSDSV